MFGSATRLTAGICEASVMMISAPAPPPSRLACFPEDPSGLFVPECYDTGWQNSALWLDKLWLKALKETTGSFSSKDLDCVVVAKC